MSYGCLARTLAMLNVFKILSEKEAEFLENWQRTTEVVKRRDGFIETHLHRNIGGKPVLQS
jgi:heme-degrading monooxygenase HmoA